MKHTTESLEIIEKLPVLDANIKAKSGQKTGEMCQEREQ
jgi:hypothetical protein